VADDFACIPADAIPRAAKLDGSAARFERALVEAIQVRGRDDDGRHGDGRDGDDRCPYTVTLAF